MIKRQVLEMMWNLGINEFSVVSGDYTFTFNLDFSDESKESNDEIVICITNPHWKTSICINYILNDMFNIFNYLYDGDNELPPSIYKDVKKAFNSKEVKKQIYAIYDRAINDNFNIDKIEED